MKQLMVLAMAALMFSCATGTKPAETQEEKFIGIQLWSVRGNMNTDAEGTLTALGEMGYDFVEAAGYRDGMFYGMEPAAFKQMVESSGMVFLGSHTGQNLPTEENWNDVMAWWDTAIAAHKAAGVEYIAQPFMSKEGYESLDGLKRFCDYLNAVGERCNAQGIRFGYHNHDGEFKELEGQTIYDFMLQNTDPAKVMFQMDLYWVVVGGKDPVDYIERYPGRFENWHVKDEAELGASGTMEFARYFEHKEKAGVKHLVVEVEKYNMEPIESVRASLDYMRNADYIR
jgi:sugar phosphate isomerase/epimerase